ncbi:tyrosine-type recombinase/integrase [Hominenteromicrobium sp.]|uniref:tyrosine-type recombinase/integrase n=1 Tax=Hominenteromicrobium sp. TaxID=3073581 RepID=UPI003AF0AF22
MTPTSILIVIIPRDGIQSISTTEQLGYDQTPHCTRHTCISMLTEAHVDQTMIKKIVGHSGAMTLTERVYTHLDIETLAEAINKI